MADRPAAPILSSPDSAFRWFNFNSDKNIYKELSEREIWFRDSQYCLYKHIAWLFVTVSTTFGMLWASMFSNFKTVF